MEQGPGEEIRVRIHLGPEITQPPHFAPEFQFHSEIDFPVIDPKELRSPTPKGQFLFYGLCHELGHLIAMWGNRNIQEDHHSWAHYTGVAIVERLGETAKDKAFMAGLCDAQWRSLSKEKEKLKDRKPSLADADSVLTLLIALDESVGTKAIGAAINLLDAQGKGPRINHVRYYSMKDFKAALIQVVKDPKGKKAIATLFPDK